MRTWVFPALCVAVSFELGCGAAAQHVSKRAAQGVLEGARRGAREAGGQGSVEPLARQMVQGALGALGQEEQLDNLGRVVHRSVANTLHAATRPSVVAAAPWTGGEAGSAAARGEPADRSAVGLVAAQMTRAFSEELARELGADGGGPLAASMSGAAERIAGAALRGAGDALPGPFPECQGEDRAPCVERRIEELSRVTSAGVARGVRDALGLGWLALAFGLGVAVALIVTWALGVLRALRGPPRGTAPVSS